ncbi:MAG: ferredoxin [Desulfovibrio sp.]|nr:ferredoxin [Desulfovibrio sp.]
MTETNIQRPICLDLGRCHGCMGCVEMCPDIVGWDTETERPYLKRQDATEAEIQDAMACCPKDCFEFADE